MTKLPPLAVLTALALPGSLAAQQLTVPGATTDSAARPAAVARLAGEAAAAYRDTNRVVLLDNLFRLRLLSGRLAEADSTLAEWRRAWAARGDTTARGRAVNVQYEIYLRAKRLQADSGAAFPDALARAFRERFARLDDRTAALVARTLNPPPPPLAGPVADTTMSVPDAVAWLRGEQIATTYRRARTARGPAAPRGRRAPLRDGVQHPGEDPGGRHGLRHGLASPRGAARLPALLNFTIYADTMPKLIDARGATPRNGYAAVVGFTRGKAAARHRSPYVHDGEDAAAVIDGSRASRGATAESGCTGAATRAFAQWAAAKRAAAGAQGDHALGGGRRPGWTCRWRGTSSRASSIPGRSSRRISRGSTAPPTTTRALEPAEPRVVRGGRAYRELDKIDGTPNPVFARTGSRTRDYDEYWQRMIPFGAEFARIRHPRPPDRGLLLRRAGRGGLYYFREHHRHQPAAEHYLVAALRSRAGPARRR